MNQLWIQGNVSPPPQKTLLTFVLPFSDIIPGCPKHDNRPFEFYDKTVNQPVCSHCVVIGDRQGHEIAPSSDVVRLL